MGALCQLARRRFLEAQIAQLEQEHDEDAASCCPSPICYANLLRKPTGETTNNLPADHRITWLTAQSVRPAPKPFAADRRHTAKLRL